MPETKLRFWIKFPEEHPFKIRATSPENVIHHVSYECGKRNKTFEWIIQDTERSLQNVTVEAEGATTSSTNKKQQHSSKQN